MNNARQPDRSGELSLIPTWARVVAVLVFVCMIWVIVYLMHREPNPPPLPAQVVLGAMAAAVVSALVLLIGYVNRDARRRGMNVLAWTLIVIFVPNALGFILYFLLRKPLPATCPRCGSKVPADSNFCTICGHQLSHTCAKCGRAVSPADTFCGSCGQKLREGATLPGA